MNRELWQESSAVVLFLVVCTALIAWTGADLAVSSNFYVEGGWPVGYRPFWQFLYRLDRTPAIVLSVFGLAMFLLSYARRDFCRWRRAGIFLVLLLVLGPGLLVNTVFKDHWGRPRPREVLEFGGNKQFLQPWQKGEEGKGRSFPSGHSSAAFYMAAPYLIYRRTGMLFGIIMSIARITQGAHFLSDTLWSFGMVALSALLLAALLKLEESTVLSPVSKE
jgi:lipid A 4'-phosphatase